MRKSGIFILGTMLSFGFLFASSDNITAKANEITVCIGGQAAGFTLKTGEVQVIGICEVFSENGTESPAMNAGLRAGDQIVKIDGLKIGSVEELNEIIEKSKNKPLNIEIKRNGETFTRKVNPVKDKITEKRKIGVLVRDCVSGIGTITYIDKKNGRFGALGHSVSNENKEEMQIKNGAVYECSIVGINKGVRGRAGELRGMFLNDKYLGNAEKLCNCGIFGEISGDFKIANAKNAVASSEGVKPGKAYIYSTINGVCPKKYDVEIVKVDKFNRENKNYVIKITDEELIFETGGIVQGMSGSPIIQEDKLVGAITHVFLNDPTRGYGINIETMMQE
ncbi:MAG: SpoIVB peptidase [Clostridia bacterium]|nr:SpoIVB peptidase [Clostridia bacterium]